MQWYYSKNGSQLGPVDDSELRRLAQLGELTPDEFVWNETMGEEWKPVSSVEGLFLPPSDQTPLIPLQTSLHLGNGMTPNRDLMRMARESLKGRWGMGVLGVLIYLGILLLTMIPQMAIEVPYVVKAQQSQILAQQSNYSLHALSPPKIEMPLSAKMIKVGFQLLQYLIFAPFIVGLNFFFLNIARRTEPNLSNIFYGFRIFWKSIGTYFLMLIFILGWVMLFCSPAIALFAWASITHQTSHLIFKGIITLGIIGYIFALIKIYSYILALMILADEPSAGVLQSIRMSTEMMKGRKWKFLCLNFRFFGWMLLALLTCGIGYLWLIPYIYASKAHFYLDVKDRA